MSVKHTTTNQGAVTFDGWLVRYSRGFLFVIIISTFGGLSSHTTKKKTFVFGKAKGTAFSAFLFLIT